MSTLTSLPREVLKWLLGLDLSFPVKNIKRDFSNGFLFAEILSRYYPDIQMHSFENVTSFERKKANWVVLERLFKRRNIPVDLQQIDAVIAAEDDAAGDVLQCIYSFINSDAYRESLQCSSSSREHSGTASPCVQHAAEGSRYPSVGRSKSTGRGMALEDPHMSGYCYGSDGARMYPAVMCAGPQDQQQIMQQLMWQQLMVQQQQQQQAADGPSRRRGPAADSAAVQQQHQQQQMQHHMQLEMQQQLQQVYTQMMGGMPAGAHLQQSPLDDLAFSKKPRAVGFQPYSLSDYEAANYDVKKTKGYWQLGRLGPEETQELQAKREARERVKELSKRISVENAQRLAAVGPARPRTKDPSARQRAVEYAKTSVPKPELLKQRSSSSGRRRGGSAPAAVAAGGAGGGSRQASQAAAEAALQQQSSPLDQLQQQHDLYAQQIEQIRQEFELLQSNID